MGYYAEKEVLKQLAKLDEALSPGNMKLIMAGLNPKSREKFIRDAFAPKDMSDERCKKLCPCPLTVDDIHRGVRGIWRKDRMALPYLWGLLRPF